ncbi:MAG: heavy metal sensor histidine kinase [Deltaproteobacteria bacterium]|nr:heavy metal sensor histidine kinase [Candidatus Zymogenaceae bacterium]
MVFTSIRVKFVAWYTLVLMVTLVAFSCLLYVFLAKALYESIDKKLITIAELTADSNARITTEPEGLTDYMEEFLGFKPSANYIQIMDKSGDLNYDSDGSLPTKLPITADTVRLAKKGEPFYETLMGLDTYPIRMINYPVMRGGELATLVQVGTSLESVKETLSRLLRTLLIIVPLILLLSSMGGYFLAKATLDPVKEIVTTAREISAMNLSRRISVKNTKDELGKLAGTFNEMIERLEKSFSRVMQFSADASHELRTPLTILKGETEWALRSARDMDAYREILTSNLEEINHMSNIIEDLLVLARADMGEMPMEMHPIALSAVLGEVYDMGKVLADMKGMELVLDVEDLDGVRILGNDLRIRQLFLNLLDNGIKYTRDGGRVDLSAQIQEETVRVKVMDNGIGISEDDQKRIFDRFYRVDKHRSRAEGGTGLGLSICRFITEAHNGTIEVSSNTGIGSTFTVTLPIYEDGESGD